ncbi:Hpt domain-containing protein [uncultured Limimaricola sp.]|uniref:Hpt domain-containing protein n=1 Tax=uncultured Limimaricola sp. TaxID=2211667 RepID=UPI0030F96ECA
MRDDVIDPSALERLLAAIGGDPEDLEELLGDFQHEGPRTLSQMQSAARAGDRDALRISAHSLKSNARDFGAVALATACEGTEHAAITDELEALRMRVHLIATELDRACGALAKLAQRDG